MNNDVDHFVRSMDLILKKINDDITRMKGEFTKPSISSYPNNACEHISVHLASVLDDAIEPKSEIWVINASSPNQGDHFWVEKAGVVLDLTAHQFNQCKEPIVCEKPSILEKVFSSIERYSPTEAIADYEKDFQLNSKLLNLMRGHISMDRSDLKI